MRARARPSAAGPPRSAPPRRRRPPWRLDLPAPLVPGSAADSRGRRVGSTAASARCRPYTLVRPRASTVSKLMVATRPRSSQLVELAVDAHQPRRQLLLLALAL